ncbi:MAG: protein translocase SEC61 complex subunit gamma [Candidatus Bathyarchaeota archaeon]|jgi:protein translocase SEC61 complex gamma subunit|nr:protein translocase SEC61 complex subunit gamma [Candidatus Bathyarchaeota archaeon]
MGINDFIESAKRLLATINKPDWKTFSLSLKIVLLGIGVLGAIGYVIRLVAVVLQPVS